MDMTDLQILIEVIAAQLRDAEATAITPDMRPAPANDVVTISQQAASVAPVAPGPDTARVIADLLAEIPAPAAYDTQASATTRNGGSTDPQDGGTLGGVAKSLLTGLGVVSLVKGLFGGQDGSPAAAAPLPKFELPDAVQQDIAYSSRTGEYMAFDRPETGGLRTRYGLSPAITVNVHAMDSKSFMDHSHEIARAVREAILNSSSLNDVVSEL
jgi:hypothetical protein